jgi:nuclear pore complex protein Nup98-Nup96
VATPPSHNTPLNFASFVSLFPTTHTTGPAALFRLGSALFDPIDLNLASGRRLGSSSITAATLITPDVRNRVSLLKRRQALSQWLEHVVKPTVEGDIRAKAAGPLSGNYTAADTVFTQLTGHQVEHACTVAMDAGYLKLATLVCQAGGDATFKADIRSQLKIWADEKLAPPSNGGSSIGPGPNGLISRGVWKVYRLLTGPDEHSDDGEMTSWVEEVCAGLDWKRVFGLCLWYGLGVDAAVADVVKLYDGLIKRYTTSTSSTLVARPIPRWQVDKQQGRSSSSSSQQSNGIITGAQRAAASTLLSSPSNGNQKQYEDPLFSLIRLHSDPALSLSQVLSPLSFGPDERWGGVGMCWHLYIILSRSMRIRDFIDRVPVSSARRINGRAQESNSGDDELESVPSQVELGPSHTANLLTSGYAFELEGWGMIQEAAFVLLHLEDTEGYVSSLLQVLKGSL